MGMPATYLLLQQLHKYSAWSESQKRQTKMSHCVKQPTLHVPCAYRQAIACAARQAGGRLRLCAHVARGETGAAPPWHVTMCAPPAASWPHCADHKPLLGSVLQRMRRQSSQAHDRTDRQGWGCEPRQMSRELRYMQQPRIPRHHCCCMTQLPCAVAAVHGCRTPHALHHRDEAPEMCWWSGGQERRCRGYEHDLPRRRLWRAPGRTLASSRPPGRCKRL